MELELGLELELELQLQLEEQLQLELEQEAQQRNEWNVGVPGAVLWVEQQTQWQLLDAVSPL